MTRDLPRRLLDRLNVCLHAQQTRTDDGHWRCTSCGAVSPLKHPLPEPAPRPYR